LEEVVDEKSFPVRR